MCCFDSRFPRHYEITLRSPNSCVVMGSNSHSALLGSAFCVTSHDLNRHLLPFSILFSGGSSEELKPRKHRGQKLSHVEDSEGKRLRETSETVGQWKTGDERKTGLPGTCSTVKRKKKGKKDTGCLIPMLRQTNLVKKIWWFPCTASFHTGGKY